MTMKACPDEGQLRAYLDEELGPTLKAGVEQHLAGCARCQGRVRDLELTAARARARVSLLQPARAEAGPAPAEALARFHARQRNVAQSLVDWRSIMSKVTRKWRPALALGVTALVLAFALSLAPVRSAASQFLSVFRVRQFAALSLSPDQVQRLEEGLAGLDHLLAGHMEVIEEPGPPREVDSLDEASGLVGFRVRAPTWLPAGVTGEPMVQVQGGGKGQFKADVDQVQALLDALGRSDLRVPAALDGATVEVVIPPVVTLNYGRMPGQRWTLIEMESPTVTLPPGVSLDQLGEIGLQILGLTPDEAREFSARIDWGSTLVVPVPTNIASFMEVTVDGVSGLLLRERRQGPEPRHATLMWQKGGIVYTLVGQGELEDFVSIANSLR